MIPADLQARLDAVAERYTWTPVDDTGRFVARLRAEYEALGFRVDDVELGWGKWGRTVNVRLAPVAEEVVVELVKRPV